MEVMDSIKRIQAIKDSFETEKNDIVKEFHHTENAMSTAVKNVQQFQLNNTQLAKKKDNYQQFSDVQYKQTLILKEQLS